MTNYITVMFSKPVPLFWQFNALSNIDFRLTEILHFIFQLKDCKEDYAFHYNVYLN